MKAIFSPSAEDGAPSAWPPRSATAGRLA
jgi:hypothetical protein